MSRTRGYDVPVIASGDVSTGDSTVDPLRRALMLTVGAGVVAPLFACGGGGSSDSPSQPAPPPTSTPLDITPTVSFDGTPSNGTPYNAFLTSTSTPNPAFSFYGSAAANVLQPGTTYPRENMVCAAAGNADTYSSGVLYATFYHDGKALDIIEYGLSQDATLYINDVFQARYAEALTSGTAQGGSATTIILAANSSTTSGFYNEYYVRIAAGTGLLNEVKQVVSYDGSTAIATLASAWTTAPDATTQYVVQSGTQPFVLDASTGSIKYIHLNWVQSGQRKITIEQGIFSGVISDGSITAAPAWSTVPVLVVGDSFWEGEAAPINIPRLLDTFAQSMGWLPTNLGQGGTGFIERNQAVNRLNFQDRIAPPMESWRVSQSATGGTFTISVTLGGATGVTDPIPYTASAANFETALNGLTNVAGAAGYFCVARGDFATPFILVGHGIAGATLSIDSTMLTGGSIDVVGSYLGDVAENLPVDGQGKAAPFYLLVVGSGNDSASSDADVQAAATYIAQQIGTMFPTATTIFTGVLGDCSAATSLITSTDISRNAALAAAASLLPKIGANTAFIDTYAAGLGQPKIIYGLGTVADPQPGTNSNLKSITDPGHPTGPGSQFLSDWLVDKVKALIG